MARNKNVESKQKAIQLNSSATSGNDHYHFEQRFISIEQDRETTSTSSPSYSSTIMNYKFAINLKALWKCET